MNIYPKNNTALLLVDPYNDFMSKEGKAWPLVRTVTKQVNLHEHMKMVMKTCRAQGWPVFYAPHHQYREGSFSDRKYLHPSQYLQGLGESFKANDFGSEFYSGFEPKEGDVVASQHDCSSGFTGTNLHEKLQEKAITHVIIIGFLSNTCIESTARSALDLGYHVTLLTDAVAAWTSRDHEAAVKYNYPHLANHLTDTKSFTHLFK